MSRRRARLIGQRIGQTLLTLIVASVMVWGLTLLSTDDPARRVLTAQRGIGVPTAAEVDAMRTRLGLDRPVWEQYGSWLGNAVQGDFGVSWRTGRPVSAEFAAHLPPTIILTLSSMLLALLISIPLGLIGALTAGRWPDALIRTVTFVMVSAPSFLLGVLLLHVVVLRWGFGQVVSDGTWSSVWLPAVALAMWPAASWSRILRGGLLEASSATYLRVSTARGAGRLRLLLAHALPNSALPFLAIVGVSVGWLLSGTPVIETVFTWPGIGYFTVQSIIARDIPVIQVFTLFGVVAFVATSLAIDLISVAIDPRIAQSHKDTRGASEPLSP